MRSGWHGQPGGAFLAFTKDDPLGPLFRIVLLRGVRRGEAAAAEAVAKLIDGASS